MRLCGAWRGSWRPRLFRETEGHRDLVGYEGFAAYARAPAGRDSLRASEVRSEAPSLRGSDSLPFTIATVCVCVSLMSPVAFCFFLTSTIDTTPGCRLEHALVQRIPLRKD